MMAEGYARRDGVAIYYKYAKKRGPWIVFLHGGSGSLSTFFSEEKFFPKQGLSTLLIDFRGHGNSDKGEGKDFFSFWNFVEDVNFVLKHLRIEKAVIVGHSFGSFVAQGLAVRYPGKVKKLVLIGSGDCVTRNRAIKLACEAFFRLARFIPYKGRKGHGDYTKHIGCVDISVPRILTDNKYCGTETYSRTLVESMGFMTPIKTGCPVPTLIVHGTKDTLVRPERAVALSRFFSNAKVVWLKTNHLSVINDTQNLNNALLEFVQEEKIK